MYFPVLLWSLVIFASFWGYGEALRRAIKRPEFNDIGWGLTAAWGMAVTLAIGGVLMAFSLAKAPTLTGMVLLGAAFASFYAAERLTVNKKARPVKKNSRNIAPKQTDAESGKSDDSLIAHSNQNLHLLYFVSDIILWTIAALAFASSIAWPYQVDPNDDLLCYLMLPEKILQTGSLIDPFNLRRALTLGGHTFIQAIVMVVGGDRSGHIADLGLGKLMLFGIAVGFFKGKSKTEILLRFLCGFIALIYPMPRINTMSAYTGCVCLLGLSRTLFLSINKGGLSLDGRLLLPSLLLCVAAATLRPFFGIPALTLCLAVILCKALPSSLKSFPHYSKTLFLALLPLLAIGPWMLVSYISSNTVYMPPFHGNINTIYMQNGALHGLSEIFFEYIKRPEIYPILLFMPFVLFLDNRLVGVILIFCCFAISSAVAIKMSTMPATEMPRYLTPILLPAALYIAANMPRNKLASLVGILSFCILFTFSNSSAILNETLIRLKSLPEQIAFSSNLHPDNPNSPGQYLQGLRNLQKTIPFGAKTLSVIDFPYLLDFSRNEIFCADVLGAAGPDGGLPYEKGLAKFNEYLRMQGIGYIICVDFNSALMLYNRKTWQNHRGTEWYYKQIWAPRFLYYMNLIDELEKSSKVLGTFYNMKVISLKN